MEKKNELDKWIAETLGEYPYSYRLGIFDAEDRKDGGWSVGVFDKSIAARKMYPNVKPPEVLKNIWRERGAPDEDVNKVGVMLVRFSGEWGYSKIYVYPVGCIAMNESELFQPHRDLTPEDVIKMKKATRKESGFDKAERTPDRQQARSAETSAK